ncbi:unnamed protein product [Acanthoscelides obtectus]|uniref:Uncharacterized protein n=1 Tax=Acanthoscelides obtectus TaxID=200917 RepID=A0A9P0PZC3_ACAOB|nr:unnamed protein product [Acanthoscelides obtectus]CAK1661002.1 hypothetical protein AOBTE_LOCUS22382 [Acanthoscelides obtectus]
MVKILEVSPACSSSMTLCKLSLFCVTDEAALLRHVHFKRASPSETD